MCLKNWTWSCQNDVLESNQLLFKTASGANADFLLNIYIPHQLPLTQEFVAERSLTPVWQARWFPYHKMSMTWEPDKKQDSDSARPSSWWRFLLNRAHYTLKARKQMAPKSAVMYPDAIPISQGSWIHFQRKLNLENKVAIVEIKLSRHADSAQSQAASLHLFCVIRGGVGKWASTEQVAAPPA